jgi:hypothetical protein
MFVHLSASPRSFGVRAACPCKKNSAAKNYEFEKKKTAYFARGTGFSDQICHRL